MSKDLEANQRIEPAVRRQPNALYGLVQGASVVSRLRFDGALPEPSLGADEQADCWGQLGQQNTAANDAENPLNELDGEGDFVTTTAGKPFCALEQDP